MREDSRAGPKRTKEVLKVRSDLARFMAQGVANGCAEGLLESARRLGSRLEGHGAAKHDKQANLDRELVTANKKRSQN